MLRTICLAIVASLLALSPAHAQQVPPDCKGSDLLAQLKVQDAARHAEILKAAGAVPNNQGLLWRIEKKGLSPSYLFGTMHVTDRRVLAHGERLASTLSQIRVLAVEIASLAPESAAATNAIATRAIDPSLKSISAIDDPALQIKLVAALGERGIPRAAGETFKPWFIAMLLSVPGCEMKRQAGKAVVLDRLIETRAASLGRRIVGLETLEEQINAIAALPDQTVNSMIRQMASLGTVRDDVFETLIATYLDGNVSRFMAASRKGGIFGTADLEGMAAFQSMLIDKRNAVMSNRALPLLAKGEVLIAVGALHLPGDSGLVNLFRKAGYQVTPVW